MSPGPKCPGTEMSLVPKCPGAEISLGLKCLRAEMYLVPKCPGTEMSLGPKCPYRYVSCRKVWDRNLKQSVFDICIDYEYWLFILFKNRVGYYLGSIFLQIKVVLANYVLQEFLFFVYNSSSEFFSNRSLLQILDNQDALSSTT